MRMTTRNGISVLGTACLLACGGKPAAKTEQYSSTPLSVTSCMAGALTLRAFSLPQTPAAATEMQFKLEAKDAGGAPVTGLELGVQPWMPEMRHGSPVTPDVSESGSGVYDVSNVDFTMVGAWQLRLTISGTMSGSCTIDVNISPSA
jgi:hypothetical protein